MLATAPDHPIDLPQAGSIGYLRGTGTRAQVLRRNAPDAHGERTALVKLFVMERGIWHPVRDAGGNANVPEADLYSTQDEALHCGRKQRRKQTRRSNRL
jgi:hypothetical protein